MEVGVDIVRDYGTVRDDGSVRGDFILVDEEEPLLTVLLSDEREEGLVWNPL
jgi:hypothetical protein